ncbi:MAG: AAA family ATPase, partial [Deltaproteobacteria bacterium]|nr:AAA family ATPase [Deltaproteobacteria bacterium]
MSTVTCPECGESNPTTVGRCFACGADLLGLARAPRFGGVLSMLDVAEVTKVDSVKPDAPDTEERPLTEPARPPLPDPLALAVDPPIVGRDEALEVMRETIARALSSSKSALVVFEGDRGLGKTRMLREAGAMALVKDPRTRILYAASREGGDGPYAPFSRLLLDRFRITPSTGPTAVRGQMATEVGEALETPDAAAVGETTHLLGHIAGVPFPGSPVLRALEGEPELLRIRAGRALRRLLEGDARKAPTMLLLDNAHFGGEDGWALLDAIVQARRVPLIVVVAGGTGTIARTQSLEPELDAQRALLHPLDETQVAEALRGLLPHLSEVPEPLAAAAFHRSKGNPAALRELCFGLVDAGLFRVTAAELGPSLDVEIDRLEDGELPLNIDDVMRGRLARLDETERQTLRNA